MPKSKLSASSISSANSKKLPDLPPIKNILVVGNRDSGKTNFCKPFQDVSENELTQAFLKNQFWCQILKIFYQLIEIADQLKLTKSVQNKSLMQSICVFQNSSTMNSNNNNNEIFKQFPLEQLYQFSQEPAMQKSQEYFNLFYKRLYLQPSLQLLSVLHHNPNMMFKVEHFLLVSPSMSTPSFSSLVPISKSTMNFVDMTGHPYQRHKWIAAFKDASCIFIFQSCISFLNAQTSKTKPVNQGLISYHLFNHQPNSMLPTDLLSFVQSTKFDRQTEEDMLIMKELMQSYHVRHKAVVVMINHVSDLIDLLHDEKSRQVVLLNFKKTFPDYFGGFSIRQLLGFFISKISSLVIEGKPVYFYLADTLNQKQIEITWNLFKQHQSDILFVNHKLAPPSPYAEKSKKKKKNKSTSTAAKKAKEAVPDEDDEEEDVESPAGSIPPSSETSEEGGYLDPMILPHYWNQIDHLLLRFGFTASLRSRSMDLRDQLARIPPSNKFSTTTVKFEE